MADVTMNANFDNYTSFTAKFGVVINSVVVDPEVTEDSSNPVASSGIFNFVEREVGIETEAREKSIAQEAQTRMEREESLYNNFSARLKNEREAREESDNTINQTIEGLSSSVVKTVNHIGPDADGNVNIEGGTGNVDDVLVDGTSVLGSDKIARIPRASSEASGTIKIGNGAQVNTAGTIRATALTKENYDSANGNTFVGKTTLENVLNPIREDISGLDDKIKELELFKFPNVTIIGTPTINNGQISNFSTTSYLKFPFLVDFRSQPFEINMCFTTGANVVNQENIFDSDFGLAFAVRNSRFVIAISTNGTSWDLGEGVGIITVQPNTTYYIKIAWNGSHYILYYSFDGTTYTADITKTSTSQPYPKQIYIGVGENFASVVNHFSGTINLNNANVKVNGEIFWTGMDDAGISTRADVSLSNIDADGEEKIKEVAETEAIKTELTNVKADYTELNAEVQNHESRIETLEQGGGEVGIDLVARAEIAKIKDDIGNYLDINWIDNAYINKNNGSQESLSMYFATDFIKILPTYKVIVKTVMANDISGLSFYNEDKQYISGINIHNTDGSLSLDNAEEVELAIPSDARYIRYSLIKYGGLNNPSQSYAKYSDMFGEIIEISNDVEEVKNGAITISTTDASVTRIDGGYIYKDGNIASLSSYFYTELFELKKGDAIRVTSKDPSGSAVARVSRWNVGATRATEVLDYGTTTETSFEYVAKENVFLRFSGSRNQPMSIKLLTPKVPELVDNVIENSIAKNSNFNYWSYSISKVLCIGDSLTSGALYTEGWDGASIDQNYPRMLERMLKANVTNGGKSGASATDWYNQEISKYNLNDYDTFIIWLGTNNGLTDGDAEYIAYSNIIENIKNTNSSCLIILAKVFASKGSVSTTNEMIDKIASTYNLMVVDNSDLGNDKHPELHAGISNPHFGKAGNIFIANRFVEEIGRWFNSNPLRCEYGYTPRAN